MGATISRLLSNDQPKSNTTLMSCHEHVKYLLLLNEQHAAAIRQLENTTTNLREDFQAITAVVTETKVVMEDQRQDLQQQIQDTYTPMNESLKRHRKRLKEQMLFNKNTEDHFASVNDVVGRIRLLEAKIQTSDNAGVRDIADNEDDVISRPALNCDQTNMLLVVEENDEENGNELQTTRQIGLDRYTKGSNLTETESGLRNGPQVAASCGDNDLDGGTQNRFTKGLSSRLMGEDIQRDYGQADTSIINTLRVTKIYCMNYDKVQEACIIRNMHEEPGTIELELDDGDIGQAGRCLYMDETTLQQCQKTSKDQCRCCKRTICEDHLHVAILCGSHGNLDLLNARGNSAAHGSIEDEIYSSSSKVTKNKRHALPSALSASTKKFRTEAEGSGKEIASQDSPSFSFDETSPPRVDSPVLAGNNSQASSSVVDLRYLETDASYRLP